MRRRLTLLTGLWLSLFFLPLLTYAQQIISGHVLSKADQSPIAGASVTIKGTRIGTSTAVDGSFSLKAKTGDKLVVTGIGVTETEQEVTGEDITIAVAANLKELNQVVVTATGIKKEAKRLGYAIQTIDASTLSTAREANPINSLKGNAAGLAVNINSEIGHSPDVIIRGENNPDDRPMFVVDGVPIASDTYNINPDDIESFTVLKGPNAAALYGFQGKNGAIIISTKKGSKTKGRVVTTVNSSTQISKGFIALPKYQDTYGAGDNGKYAFAGGGSSPASYFGSGAVGVGVNDYDYDVWGPQFRGQLLPQYDGEYDPNTTYTTTFASGKPFTGHVKPTPWVARGKDNLRKFIQTGLLSTNSIAISSSTEKTDIRISAGNTYQRGIVPNTQLNNANFTASIVQRFNPKLSVTTYFNYSRQSTPNIPDVNYGPNSIIYNIILWGGADWAMSDMKDYWQPGKAGVQQKYAEYYRYNNPYFMSYEWLRGHYQNNEYGYISVNYKLNQNIDFQFRPSLTAYDMTNTERLPYSAGAYGRLLRQGDYREDRRSLFESNEDLQVRYHKNAIGGFLDVQALGGATARTFSFNSNYESTNYLNIPGIYAFSNSLNALTGSSYRSSMLVLSAYYSVDLGYKSYITANITGRVDKSSTLPSNANSYFYPSFNLASVVSEYVHLPSFISFLKVRGSYAASKSGGTSAFFSPNVSSTPASQYGYYWASPYNGPNYQFRQSYTLSPTYSTQISAAYADALIGNSVQTADRKAYEAGLDIRFLNNRLGLDVTRYHYLNTGIVNQLVSSSSGYSSSLVNGDRYTNDGWEAVISGTPISNKDGFSWNIVANFSTYVRRWKEFVSNPDNYEKNGSRVDLVYDDAFVRTPDGKFVIDSSGLYMRFKEEGGSSAKKIYGHADPDWQWGLVNTFSYKNFSLRFQFDGIVGGVIEDNVRKKTLQAGRHIESATGAFGVARPSDEANVDAYLGEGVNFTNPKDMKLDPITGEITNIKDLNQIPNVFKSQVQPFVTRMASIPDLDIVKKTYAKLREVVITYKVPSKVFGKRSIISDASISLVGRNLLYFFPSRYKDLDVDQYTQGTYSVTNTGKFGSISNSSGLQTPTTRSYGVNINFSF
ncbi:MAG: SusC/RagA family TonB-linked outer membrane protein [Chitinophagaceae bacterium]|nr:SusC/RagA family TonB-linked outer membrane protein [Chitinophagaceae bacterium]